MKTERIYQLAHGLGLAKSRQDVAAQSGVSIYGKRKNIFNTAPQSTAL
ncbi:hypothetical protein [Parasphingorhabdus litoris]|nr:hypothetical protein [Parasphingorhabdus litoris]